MLSEPVVGENVIASHLARMLVATAHIGPKSPHGNLSDSEAHNNGYPGENQLVSPGLERRKGVGFLFPGSHLGVTTLE